MESQNATNAREYLRKLKRQNEIQYKVVPRLKQLWGSESDLEATQAIEHVISMYEREASAILH